MAKYFDVEGARNAGYTDQEIQTKEGQYFQLQENQAGHIYYAIHQWRQELHQDLPPFPQYRI